MKNIVSYFLPPEFAAHPKTQHNVQTTNFSKKQKKKFHVPSRLQLSPENSHFFLLRRHFSDHFHLRGSSLSTITTTTTNSDPPKRFERLQQRFHPNASRNPLPIVPPPLLILRGCRSCSQLHAPQPRRRFRVGVHNGSTPAPRLRENHRRLLI